MKKILILFLLIFPLLIFAIVNIAATVISYYLTLPVERVETVEGSYIHTTELNSTSKFSFRIVPTEARNLSFTIYNDEDDILVEYDGENPPQINFIGDDSIISLSIPETEGYYNNGVFSFAVTTKNFGLTQLTIVTEDGKYEAKSDIFVQSPSSDPSEIQGIVLDYQDRHQDFEFGINNDILVYYTYFPKMAVNIGDAELENQINETLRDNAGNIDFAITNNLEVLSNEIIENGRGVLNVKLNSVGESNLNSLNLIKNGSFKFNGNSGYNIYSEDQLRLHGSDNNTYLMKEVFLSEWLVLSNVNLNGNGYKINHTNLSYYTETTSDGNIRYTGRHVVEILSGGRLTNVHLIGPLSSAMVPHENISNLLLRADSNSNNDNAFNLENVTLENGRYNISVIGKSTAPTTPYIPTTFNFNNLTLIGSAFAALEVNNSSEGGIFINSTRLNLSNIKISYTAVGILLQNSSNQRGYAELNFISNNGNPSVVSDSWRNLDDASGALSTNNFGHILQELKSYSDVIHQDGDDYYVNPLIMIRGGTPNHSIINFTNDDQLLNMLIDKVRNPNLIESAHPAIGGTAPFTVYLVDPIYYSNE